MNDNKLNKRKKKSSDVPEIRLIGSGATNARKKLSSLELRERKDWIQRSWEEIRS